MRREELAREGLGYRLDDWFRQVVYLLPAMAPARGVRTEGGAPERFR